MTSSSSDEFFDAHDTLSKSARKIGQQPSVGPSPKSHVRVGKEGSLITRSQMPDILQDVPRVSHADNDVIPPDSPPVVVRGGQLSIAEMDGHLQNLGLGPHVIRPMDYDSNRAEADKFRPRTVGHHQSMSLDAKWTPICGESYLSDRETSGDNFPRRGMSALSQAANTWSTQPKLNIPSDQPSSKNSPLRRLMSLKSLVSRHSPSVSPSATRVVNISTGLEMDLMEAERKMPGGVNPLSLHIMRLTSQYIGRADSGADTDSEDETTSNFSSRLDSSSVDGTVSSNGDESGSHNGVTNAGPGQTMSILSPGIKVKRLFGRAVRGVVGPPLDTEYCRPTAKVYDSSSMHEESETEKKTAMGSPSTKNHVSTNKRTADTQRPVLSFNTTSSAGKTLRRMTHKLGEAKWQLFRTTHLTSDKTVKRFSSHHRPNRSAAPPGDNSTSTPSPPADDFAVLDNFASHLNCKQALNGVHSGAIWCAKFSTCAHLLATAGQDCVVRIWAGQCVADQFKEWIKVGRRDVSLLKFKDVDLSSSFYEQPLCQMRGHTSDVLDISWSKNYFLLTSSMDKTVRLWHISQPIGNDCGPALCVFQHIDFVTSLAFHPSTDQYFVSGSLDGKIRLWHIPSKQVAVWTDVHDSDSSRLVTAVTFIKGGKFIAVGTYDGHVLFYSTETLKLHTTIQVHRGRRRRRRRGTVLQRPKVTGLEVMSGSTDDKLLVTSNDCRVRLYDLRDLRVILKLKGFVNSTSHIKASCSPDGRLVACGSENHYFYIWPVVERQSSSADHSLGRRLGMIPYEAFKAAQSSLVTCCVFSPVLPSSGAHIVVTADFKGTVRTFVSSAQATNRL